MVSTQTALLFIAVLIVLVVILFSAGRFFRKPHTAENTSLENDDQLPNVSETNFDESIEGARLIENETEIRAEKSPQTHCDYMMISVHAKPNTYFSDYSFLQTLGSTGLEYGEHQIFHYDVKTDNGIQRLFSVAQLNKPGTFDLDNIDVLRCKGLLLFIDLNACRKKILALDCMLEVAYQLTEDLDGIMYEGYNTPWTDDTPKLLAQQIEGHVDSKVSVLDEITY